MDLKKCINNLKDDLSNGGVEDDSFAMLCYLTMANEALRLLEDDASSQEIRDDASEYLTICRSSGYESLMLVSEA